jgi:hypothetical protein
MTTVTLRWENPTTRVDDSELNVRKIAQVHIFDSASSTPSVPIAAVPGGDTSYRTGVLSPGTHNFTVVVIDVDGQASEPSKTIASVVVEAPPALAAPGPVADLVVEARDADNRIVAAKPDAAAKPIDPAAKPAATGKPAEPVAAVKSPPTST